LADAQSESANSEESSRWNGGTSPRGYGNSVQVMERELRSSDESSDFDAARAASENLANHLSDRSMTITPNGSEGHEVIEGVDPTMLSNYDTSFSGHEMQERSGMPMLSGRASGGEEEANTIDCMDLDQVVEDGNVKEENASVEHVGIAE
jgi:hypothetical protein